MLRGNNVSTLGVKELVNVLKKNPNITSLELGDNNLGDEGVSLLSDSLGNHGTLKSLDVQYNGIGRGGAQEIARMLSTNSVLRTLDVQLNNLGKEGAALIAEALHVNHTLTSLNIGHNNIMDEGCSAIARMLKTNTTLESLGMTNNNIGNDGAQTLATMLQQNKSLTALEVLACNQRITDESVVSVFTRMAQIQKSLEANRARTTSTRTSSTTEESVKEFDVAEAEEVNPLSPEPHTTPTQPSSQNPTTSSSVAFDPISVQYAETRVVPLDVRIPDGFVDLTPAATQPLAQLSLADPVALTPRVVSAGLLTHKQHPFIKVELANPAFQQVLRKSHALLSTAIDVRHRVQFLALVVCEHLGGSCTEDIFTKLYCESVAVAKRKSNSNVVPLGVMTHATTRQRALLFKVLADYFKVYCSLESPSEGPYVHTHAWNTVQLGMLHEVVVDLWANTGALYSTSSDEAASYCKQGTVPPPPFPPAVLMPEDVSQGSAGMTRYISLPDANADIKKHSKLGGGAMGSVYRCTLGGVTFAMKKVSISGGKNNSRRAIREIAILEQLTHPNIVKYLGHELTVDGAEVAIFMEYVPISLYSYIRRLRQQNQVLRDKDLHVISLEVAKGLHYLHHKAPIQIVHRDLKSKNILLDLDAEECEIRDVKLCDFGVSKVVSDETEAHTMVGTYYWMAPEILSNDRKGYTSKADMWSYGMVLVELLTLRNPYHENGGDWAKTKSMILAGIPPKLPPSCPQKMKEIVLRCLQLVPEARPTSQEVILYLISNES
eukprot:PhF_6_TR33689/c0_g1_i2/m.49380